VIEGLVIDRRRRVRCGFGFDHLDKKAKEGEEKGKKNEGLEEDGVTQ